ESWVCAAWFGGVATTSSRFRSACEAARNINATDKTTKRAGIGDVGQPVARRWFDGSRPCFRGAGLSCGRQRQAGVRHWSRTLRSGVAHYPRGTDPEDPESQLSRWVAVSGRAAGQRLPRTPSL